MNFPILSKAAIGLGNGNLSIETTQILAPVGDEVVVEIKAAGVCHTDFDSLGWGKKIVMGHEGVGIVRAVGTEVTQFEEGDHVILNWAIPCKKCAQCRRNNFFICENNSPVIAGNAVSGGHARLEATQLGGQGIERSFSLGTLSEYSIVKASALVKIPQEIDFKVAAFVGCAVMTGVGSVLNIPIPFEPDSALVLGVGGVGINVIQGLKIRGIPKIIAVDISAKKLEIAQRFGATHTILNQASKGEFRHFADLIRQINAGQLVDLAYECTAIPALGAAPLACIRHGGMAVQVSGIEEDLTIDMRLFEWNKLYLNPLYGNCNPEIDFPRLFRLYQEGQLQLGEQISAVYPLDNLPQAFKDMHSGENIKGVITFA
ncbi:MAG: alcohol dehydrogenase catalytic domain-containing protein [Microscillaceae bacterium]|nr:alcohol dehydrogenase catalytic domain-containing protein [Microscillaceae bacterium]